ncbi:glycosyltransferase [Hallella multisaccharivorax]|uniref:glycosyltransferase n=1 Tax=Hallella multisaccharivorax TaxID=310514 RepID=UPI00360C157F
MDKKKLIRLTTADISLEGLLEGQLRFLSQYYDVVGVASDTGVLNKVAERESIRVVNVPMRREISPLQDLRSLRDLYRLFCRERPWCVHANTPKGSLLAMMAAWAARVPHRVYTVTGLRYQGVHGLMRGLLKAMERVTCCCATNVIPEGNGVLHSLKTDHITRKPLRVLHFGNINGKDTRHLSRRQTVADYIQAPYDKVTDEDIDDLRRSWRQKLGFSDDDFVFVFIGRMTNDKGMRELAQAMKHLTERQIVEETERQKEQILGEVERQKGQIGVGKEVMGSVRLLLVGQMEEGDAIPDDVRQFFLHDEAVRYVGLKHDVRPLLLMADALVFPSYREGFPNVPMEAGAMGLASIVTDVNGSNEIIKDGLNGRIIPSPLDKKGHLHDITLTLTEAMQWFVLHPAEVRRMADNAPRMIHERYEQRDVWQALLEYYDSLSPNPSIKGEKSRTR